MKKMTRSILTLILAGAGIGLSGADGAFAQYTPGASYQAPPVPQYVAPAPQILDPQQLDQLLGPIALYPDPLLSEVLAAATYPQDIVAAQQWLQYFPNPSESDIDQQPWDDSVKALVHYPPVLQMLASQPDWTAALGAAFANQPQDVMDSVQRLRQQAMAAQTLASTPQQQVINDNGVIEILPASPDIIYVPQYDPAVVYYAHPGVYQPWISFGSGFGVGLWLNLGWDWHNRRLGAGVRWGRDWRRPNWSHVSVWRHNPARPIPVPPRFPHQPHGVGPGWGSPGRAPVPAFDDRFKGPGGPRGPERPVVGLPRPAERPGQGPGPVERPGAGPRPNGGRVEAPPRVEAPRAPEGPRISQPTPPRVTNERPVEGLPRGGGENRPSPGPVQHGGGGGGAPSPVFQGGGGAGVQSARGHGSMRR